MAVVIREKHLEEQIKAEGKHRGHKTLARTARDLVHERLMQLASDREKETDGQRQTTPAA